MSVSPNFALGLGHNSRFTEVMVAVIPKRTSAQLKREISAIRRAAKKITTSKSTARKFLQEHGFITKSGKISKHYR